MTIFTSSHPADSWKQHNVSPIYDTNLILITHISGSHGMGKVISFAKHVPCFFVNVNIITYTVLPSSVYCTTSCCNLYRDILFNITSYQSSPQMLVGSRLLVDCRNTEKMTYICTSCIFAPDICYYYSNDSQQIWWEHRVINNH